MGGSSSFSKSMSRQTSNVQHTERQSKVFDFLNDTFIPMAQGKDTPLSQLMAMRTREEGAGLQKNQLAQSMEVGAQTGMSNVDFQSVLKNLNDTAMQGEFKRLGEQKQSNTLNAMTMLGKLPLAPGTKSKQKSTAMSQSSSGGISG